MAFSVPHTPSQEEERWLAPYEGTIKDPSRRLYAASVTHMDDAIGRIVEALERAGQREGHADPLHQRQRRPARHRGDRPPNR